MVKLHYFRSQRYSKLKKQCEQEERLFVDAEFPAENRSLFFSRELPQAVEWKRPQVGLKFCLSSAGQLSALQLIVKV